MMKRRDKRYEKVKVDSHEKPKKRDGVFEIAILYMSFVVVLASQTSLSRTLPSGPFIYIVIPNILSVSSLRFR